MKIEIRRKGKEVKMYCEGDFPEHITETYHAASYLWPVVFIRPERGVWFGGGMHSFVFDTDGEAKESFEKTKNAALDYKNWLQLHRSKKAVNMKKYEIGHKGRGGIVFHIDGNKVYEAQFWDLGIFNWHKAIEACEKSDSMGYKDWYLPSKDELNLIYKNLHLKGVGGFAPNTYWSSSEYSSDSAWRQHFNGGTQDNNGKGDYRRVRAARVFDVDEDMRIYTTKENTDFYDWHSLSGEYESSVRNLIIFCEWILKNIPLCDRRCEMRSLFDKDIQECTREICIEVELECLLNLVKARMCV